MSSLDVSLLLDGQLNAEECRAALQACATDAGRRDDFTLYALVGDVLRGNSFPDDGFSRRIFARLQSEGVKMEPGYDPLGDERP